MALQNVGHAFIYGAWLIKEIFVAGFGAVGAAFRKNAGIEPIVIFYPVRVTSEWELFWFSTSITATPGTLSMGFREDPSRPGQKVLLVQAVFGENPDEQIEGLIDMEEHLKPSVANEPLEPSQVAWEPYHSLETTQSPSDVPPAERLD